MPDHAFQRLWTKYAALPEYKKDEWVAAYNEIWNKTIVVTTPDISAALCDGSWERYPLDAKGQLTTSVERYFCTKCGEMLPAADIEAVRANLK